MVLGVYLTVKKDKKEGGYIAVISKGSPQRGDKDIVVLTVGRCKTIKDCNSWYDQQMQTTKEFMSGRA